MFREFPTFLPEELLVYLRKSRSDDPTLTDEEVLNKHEAILKAWIEKNLSGPIPEENWYREVGSGETIKSRPRFQEVLNRIETPKIRGVLVVECSRLGRPDLEEIGKISKLFKFTHTHVVTPQMIFDLNYEYDRENFERELMRGNEYLEYYKKIQKRGKLISVSSEGNYLGSVPPYGYRKIKVLVGKKKCPTLDIIEDEAKVVRMIFNWYVNEGLGAMKIAKKLNEMGIRSATGNLWRDSVVRGILTNEHYTGKVRWYRTVYDNKVVNQEIFKKKVWNKDYELYDGRHDAIISEELFEKAQQKRGSIPKYKSGTELQNPLASLFFCKCGKAMHYRYIDGCKKYKCTMQTRCHNASVDYDDIIKDVCNALKSHIDDLTIISNESNDDIVKQYEERVELLRSRLKDVQVKEIAIWEKYAEEDMPRMVFDSLKEKCANEKKALETALSEALNEMPARKDYEEQIITLHNAFNALMDDSIPADVKNKLLKACIERIEYSREPIVRMSKEEAKEKGVTTKNGWYAPDYKLDIHSLF